MPETAQQTVVSAPGKIILMGEHAAVYGHPAVVAAIDLRLQVTATARKDHRVAVDLPELQHVGRTSWDEVVAYTDACRTHWNSLFGSPHGNPADYSPLPGPPERLVLIALGETVGMGREVPQLGVDLRIDSKLPLGSGFGSSAALAAGVAAAYLKVTGHGKDTELLHRIALEVERRQHGAPSGVDNNAVIRGGLLWAQRDDDGQLELEPITTTSPLLSRLRVFHSGNPAEPTGVLVAAVRRRVEHARKQFKAVLERIDRATHELKTLLLGDQDEPSRLIALIKQAEAALEELGVVPEAVKRIIRRIEAAGGAAKISGAGALTGDAGGSILVYHPEPESIQGFPSGWLPLPVRLGSDGLRSEDSA
ncbi:MAG: mevalonate kinase [Planctomycetes bacterium]|nr:mevalonate kinase [Planctomycetota bacterium]